MPAFLPTIQAKTHTKQLAASKSSSVRRYLVRNDLTNRTTSMESYTADSLSSDSTLACVSVLRNSVLPREGNMTTSRQKVKKKRKNGKHKTKCKQTGNKKKKVGKLYVGLNRELSNTTASTGPKRYHTFVAPQEELVSHFSRISMRQVQATLNSNRLALPSI